MRAGGEGADLAELIQALWEGRTVSNTSDAITVHPDSRFGPAAWEVRAPEHFRRCSYCGGIHPEDFVTAVEAGAKPDMADWKYGWPHKLYAEVPARGDNLDWLGGTSGGVRPPTPEELRARGFTPVADLTPEERAVCERQGINLATYHGVIVGPRKSFTAKFYTVHAIEPWVSEELRQKIAKATGYLFTPAGDGQLKWQKVGS